jgi:hypothetical protein
MTFAGFAPYISVASLIVSAFTLWFTILRRGTVKSTHPAFFAFRYDFVDKKVPQAKIFLRILLFSTAKRGCVVDTLFLRVREGTRQGEFSFWGMGDKDLLRASGLFVPESGIASNHHFNPADSEKVFAFTAGTYSVELVANLLGRKRPISLWRIDLQIPEGAFDRSIARETAVFFSWSPEQRRYIASVERRSGYVHAISDPQQGA